MTGTAISLAVVDWLGAAACVWAASRADRRLRQFRVAGHRVRAYRLPILRLRPSLYRPEGLALVRRAWLALIGAGFLFLAGVSVLAVANICAAPHHPC